MVYRNGFNELLKHLDHIVKKLPKRTCPESIKGSLRCPYCYKSFGPSLYFLELLAREMILSLPRIGPGRPPKYSGPLDIVGRRLVAEDNQVTYSLNSGK
jgi:hypothetical protein